MKTAEEWANEIVRAPGHNFDDFVQGVERIQRDALEEVERDILNALFHELSVAEPFGSGGRVRRVATPEGKRAMVAVKEAIRALMQEGAL